MSLFEQKYINSYTNTCSQIGNSFFFLNCLMPFFGVLIVETYTNIYIIIYYICIYYTLVDLMNFFLIKITIHFLTGEADKVKTLIRLRAELSPLFTGKRNASKYAWA